MIVWMPRQIDPELYRRLTSADFDGPAGLPVTNLPRRFFQRFNQPASICKGIFSIERRIQKFSYPSTSGVVRQWSEESFGMGFLALGIEEPIRVAEWLRRVGLQQLR
jgi:hypothetical protein